MAAELGGVEPIESTGRPPRCVWPTLRMKTAALADSLRRLLVK